MLMLDVKRLTEVQLIIIVIFGEIYGQHNLTYFAC